MKTAFQSAGLHILTAHTKGKIIEPVWNMVDPTCSNAEGQQRDLSHANSLGPRIR